MKYDLVLEGGGAKGMAFAGAYDEFVQRGHTIGRLLGTSAGAIAAALLAAGYTPDELLRAMQEKQDGKSVFATFLAEPLPFTKQEILNSDVRQFLRGVNITCIPDFLEEKIDDSLTEVLAKREFFHHLFALVERGGWFSAEPFVAWLSRKLDAGSFDGHKRDFSRTTLRQFFEGTGVELSVVASDTSDGKLLVLNHWTSPDCPLVRAIRMSMSIPLLWDEVVWDPTWGSYIHAEIKGHAIVDGGLLSNFPLELFVSDEPQVTALMGQKHENPVMGWLIDESLPVVKPGGERGGLVDMDVKLDELRIIRRLQSLVNTATSAHDKMVLDAYQDCVVRLPAEGYGTTEFDMSDGRRTALLENARRAVADYFDRHRAHVRTGKTRSRAISGPADRIAMQLLGLQRVPTGPQGAQKASAAARRTARSRRLTGKRPRRQRPTR